MLEDVAMIKEFTSLRERNVDHNWLGSALTVTPLLDRAVSVLIIRDITAVSDCEGDRNIILHHDGRVGSALECLCQGSSIYDSELGLMPRFAVECERRRTPPV